MSKLLSRFARVALFACLSGSSLSVVAAPVAENNATPMSNNMAKVAGGQHYTLVVRDDGSLWSIGRRIRHGQGSENITELKPIIGPSGATYVSAGSEHSYALLNDGSVLGWGNNYYGQLGDGTLSTRNYPVEAILPDSEKVVAIAAGHHFGLLLTDTGTVRATGYNATNQRANAADAWGEIQFPPEAASITYIAAGYRHGLALDENGVAWAWGSNSHGELGNVAATNPQADPVQVELPTDRRFVQVAAAYSTSYALDENGNVWSWGNDISALGRTGSGAPAMLTDPELNNITSIHARGTVNVEYGVLFMARADDTFWALGHNSNGQLANGTTISSRDAVQMRFENITPIELQLGYRSAYAVVDDQRVFGWGQNDLNYNMLAQSDRSMHTLPVVLRSEDIFSDGFSRTALADRDLPYYVHLHRLQSGEDSGSSTPKWRQRKGYLAVPALEAGGQASFSVSGTFNAGGILAFTVAEDEVAGTLTLYDNDEMLWDSQQLSSPTQRVEIELTETARRELRWHWQASSAHEAAVVQVSELSLPAGELSLTSRPVVAPAFFNGLNLESLIYRIDSSSDAWLETRRAGADGGDTNWIQAAGRVDWVTDAPYEFSHTLADLSCGASYQARIAVRNRTGGDVDYSGVSEVATLSCDSAWLSEPEVGGSQVAAYVDIEKFLDVTPDFSAEVYYQGSSQGQPVEVSYDQSNQALLISQLECESSFDLSVTAQLEGFSLTTDFSDLTTTGCNAGYDIRGGDRFDEGEVDACFIATAAFGSLLDPKVSVLREFRDHVLRGNRVGDAFIASYYKLSPPVADQVREHGWLAALIRLLLLPLIGFAWLALHMPWLLAVALIASVAVAVPKLRRALLAAAAVVTLSACASGPSETFEAEQYMRTQMERFAEEQGFNYGHGVGMDQEEAIQNARYRLAEQVLVSVRSESEQRVREGDEGLSASFTRAVFSWSNVQLENVRIDTAEQHGDGWYARMSMTDRDLRRSIERAHRIAPALDKVLQLERTAADEPLRRLRRALEGLAVVARDSVGAETFTTADGQSAIFSNYFQAQVETSVRAMRVLPLLQASGNGYRFVVIDDASHRPQPGAAMLINGEEVITDASGITETISSDDLGEAFDVHILGYGRDEDTVLWMHPQLELMHNARFARGALERSSRATLYVYKNPDDANIILDGRSQAAPRVLEVESGRTYKVSAELNTHRSQQQLLEVPKGAAFVFLDFRLQEREYGAMSLSTEGRDGRFKIYRNGQLELTTESNAVNQDFEVGEYLVRIGHLQRDETFDPDYQLIEDRFHVTQDGLVEHQYVAPAYRSPFHEGWRFNLLSTRSGGQPEDGFKIPWVQGRDIGYGDLRAIDSVRAVDYVSPHGDFELQIQRYFNRLNFSTQFSAGTRSHRMRIDRDGIGPPVELELDALVATAGAGFWYSAWNDSIVSSVTVNYAAEVNSWDDASRAEIQMEPGGPWERLPGDSTFNSYAFLELNSHFSFGGGFGLTFAFQTPLEGVEPMFRFGIGYTGMKKGYRIPASVEAQRGRHRR
ncbi:RCC1 domain-containing protein [Aliidiomarina soli]|uniref:Uncharacterized protein n=1 Tax=Aliidiomarina soli TaxID=1928574 RepID=A0A432WD48_9GAMM|nr:CFI-box-CTERM domain-containing protein [Aliidiomarina soli]RUO30325.1 hypothetical protein CWE14_13220 [Aliidiomarina soli]